MPLTRQALKFEGTNPNSRLGNEHRILIEFIRSKHFCRIYIGDFLSMMLNICCKHLPACKISPRKWLQSASRKEIAVTYLLLEQPP